MVFGLLKDIKNGEYRTIATPREIASIASDGHTALVQRGAGEAAGFPDAAYEAAGARLTEGMEEIYACADLVTKVKELEPCEFGLLRPGQMVFTCIHPAAHPAEVRSLLESGCIAFSAEDSHRYGSPNCEAAGKQGALFGLESMLTINGGKGKYVGGLAGAPAMKVLILGGGNVGQGALSVLYALGARVTVMDTKLGLLRQLKRQYHERIDTALSSKENIAALLPETDMVLNCVKWHKGTQGWLIDRPMLRLMEKGSVLVDISCDENGAIETFRETTHENPRYIEEGVVHYCVPNIAGAIANSASIAFAASVIPHFRALLNLGVKEACVRDGYLRRSLTVYKGVLTHEETSAIQGLPWARPEEVLGIADRALDPAPPATVTRSENRLTPEQLKNR